MTVRPGKGVPSLSRTRPETMAPISGGDPAPLAPSLDTRGIVISAPVTARVSSIPRTVIRLGTYGPSGSMSPAKTRRPESWRLADPNSLLGIE